MLDTPSMRLMSKILVLGSLSIILPVEAVHKYNVSLTQLSSCQTYDIHAIGYSYKDFFLVHSLNNTKIKDDERLHLKFYVMTDMDAHVLLTVNDHPRILDRVYEIVIGAGGDTFSAIRTNMGRRRVATNQQEPQLLSVFEPTPIEIIQKKDGKLEVYITGYTVEPLLSYTDADPLSINYISFSSFGFNNARWFYDCAFDGFDNEIEQEVREIPIEQKLLNAVAESAANASLPMDLQQVNFKFEIHSVYFVQELSVLKTRMNLLMYWEDRRLQWDPESYNGQNVIMQHELPIWLPKVTVLNGAFETFYNFDPSQEIILLNNGSVMLSAQNVELLTWCRNTQKNWPSEQFICSINIGLDAETLFENDALILEYDNTRPIADEPVNTLSEWHFAAIIVDTIKNANVGKRNQENGIAQLVHGDIVIGIEIGRNSNFYKGIFTMPILACQTLIILSFMLRGYRRGALLLVAFVIVSLGMIFITKHSPPNYVPNLLALNQHLMRITTFCYLLHILIMWLEKYPPKQPPYDWVMYLINYSPFRLVLCMRVADSTEYVDIQQYPWYHLAKIFNNLSFIFVNLMIFISDAVLLYN